MKLSHTLRGLACALMLAAPSLAGEPQLSVHVDPARIKIGQPFTVVVDCIHDHGTALRFDVLDLDDLWWQTSKRRILTLPLDDKPGRDLTQVRWELAGLEPGEHELELPAVTLTGGLSREQLSLPVAHIEIEAELSEEEDLARDLAGFRPPPEQRASAMTAIAMVAAALLLLLGAIVIYVIASQLRKRNRRRSMQRRPLTLVERLRALDVDDPAQAREAFALAAHVVRERLDQALGQDRSGLTDEEWIAGIEGSGRGEVAGFEGACGLLRSAEAVKYGMEQPTRWAAEQVVVEARGVLELSAANGEASKLEEVSR